MAACPPLTREMLPGPVDPVAAMEDLDSPRAKEAPGREPCALHLPRPWFDLAPVRFPPDTVCCREGLPGWPAYALRRGAASSLTPTPGP